MSKFTQTLKQIRMQKIYRIFTFTTSVGLLVYFIIGSFLEFNEWSKDWSIEFQNPIQNFIIIKPSQTLKTAPGHEFIHKAEAKAISPEEMNTEEYIAYKFGKDAKMALAVSQAENGTRQCDRVGINKNNTLDLGIFQINT